MKEDDVGAARDLELVRAAQAGSQGAFRELVERHQALVCSVAYALTGSLGQSEEVAQECFVTAWKHLGRLRQPDRFRSWILGITRNLSRRWIRDRRGWFRIGQKEVPDEASIASAEASPLEQIISREEERALGRALAAIPESYRVPLVLFYRDKQSVENVARELEMSESNVKQRLSRGRRMLQAQMAALAESTLARTRPGKPFAAGVILALSAAGAGASAAPLGFLGAGKALGVALATLALVIAGALLVTRTRAPSAPAAPAGPAVKEGRGASAGPTQVHAASFRTIAAGASQKLGGAAQEEERAAKEPPHVFRFDFEDGLVPEISRQGQVTTCPERAGNRHCAIGTLLAGKSYVYSAVGFTNESPHLFRHASGLTLSFDYWLGSEDASLNVQISDFDQHPLMYHIRLPKKDVVHGAWAHLALPLATALPSDGSARRIEDGDAIVGIYLLAAQTHDRPFYVDNVELGRP